MVEQRQPKVALEHADQTIVLHEGSTTIGRGVECDIRLNDGGVSRQHVQVVVGDGTIVALDQGSRNGTYVNGERIAGPFELAHGDQLQIGNRTFTVKLVSPGDRGDEWVTQARSPAVPTAVVPEAFACSECGARIPLDERVCPRCGTVRPSSPHSETGVISLEQIDAAGAVERQQAGYSTEIQVVYTSSDLALEAVASELTQTSAFLATDMFDDVGTYCALILLVDGAPALEVTGTVRSVNPEPRDGAQCGMRVSFDILDPKTRGVLDGILRKIDAR